MWYECMGNSQGWNGFSLKMYRMWTYDYDFQKRCGEELPGIFGVMKERGPLLRKHKSYKGGRNVDKKRIICMFVLIAMGLAACKKEPVQDLSLEEMAEIQSYTIEETAEEENNITEEESYISKKFREQLELYAQSYELWQGFEEWDGGDWKV